MEEILFEKDLLKDTNTNYKNKKPIFLKILGVFLYVAVIVLTLDAIFNLVFIKAQVVGISMMPTYNKNLDATTVYDSSYYESSPYKDIVYANRFKKGTNRDIILLQLNNELVIKRIVAVGGQKVTLKLGNGSNDLTNYYYYIDEQLLNEDYIYSREDMNLQYFNRFCYGDSGVERNINVNVVLPGAEAEFVVPDDCYFVLGDNRLVSGDSVRFGVVGASKIFGKVEFSYEYNQNIFSYFWQRVCAIF